MFNSLIEPAATFACLCFNTFAPDEIMIDLWHEMNSADFNPEKKKKNSLFWRRQLRRSRPLRPANFTIAHACGGIRIPFEKCIPGDIFLLFFCIWFEPASSRFMRFRDWWSNFLYANMSPWLSPPGSNGNRLILAVMSEQEIRNAGIYHEKDGFYGYLINDYMKLSRKLSYFCCIYWELKVIVISSNISGRSSKQV